MRRSFLVLPSKIPCVDVHRPHRPRIARPRIACNHAEISRALEGNGEATGSHETAVLEQLKTRKGPLSQLGRMSRTKCDYSKALQFWWQSRKSRRPSFCRDLVRSFPGVFNFPGRSHPTLVAAATRETLELSRAASKYPCARDGHLSAGVVDPAFERVE